MATPKPITYSLKEKAKALSQIEEENLTLSEMERKSTIPRKCLSDWAKKVPNITTRWYKIVSVAWRWAQGFISRFGKKTL